MFCFVFLFWITAIMEQQAQFDVTIIRILKINVYVNGLEWRKAHFPESEEKQFSLTIAGTSRK